MKNKLTVFLSAFSTVVADNQFSTLGIVLLAALARLSKITGISHQLKMQPVSESKMVSKAAKEKPTEKLKDVAKPTKKKKKKNAIDDLFSGLF